MLHKCNSLCLPCFLLGCVCFEELGDGCVDFRVFLLRGCGDRMILAVGADRCLNGALPLRERNVEVVDEVLGVDAESVGKGHFLISLVAGCHVSDCKGDVYACQV